MAKTETEAKARTVDDARELTRYATLSIHGYHIRKAGSTAASRRYPTIGETCDALRQVFWDSEESPAG